ncbi:MULTISPECIES: hypothetical protein [unclassified Arthrobacter]|uniref:hypothetical protein n=1 Tax=unclassified Arthrobacter TaxID=235627 RepID=UPI001D151BB0|nr:MULTISPECIES: hypothetical protein [unclassified Arthrobacter]MCC3274420.1 hypothetical protein [Arthrobacter sp. zg-Y20]MCC3279585.1 hypothetical protein [Arthrobacter sp. zg-Y40]MCC9177986.1 hypothetical protein [Arthrobacter sp. zg-Y750]MDK1314576.1 hypothetical protein [Arthrobacter sp. zg.Y20]MDK1327464.1 hypothetical protein [Arthrobacter sp. zg-Y1143]
MKGTSEENRRQSRRVVALILATAVLGWLTVLLPWSAPWRWTLAGILLALTAVILVILVRLQRAR